MTLINTNVDKKSLSEHLNKRRSLRRLLYGGLQANLFLCVGAHPTKNNFLFGVGITFWVVV
jgi:hypothetical protein